MVGLVEDAGDALHLYLDMVNKTLPHRLIADGTITCNSSAATITDKDYLAILVSERLLILCNSHVNPMVCNWNIHGALLRGSGTCNCAQKRGQACLLQP